jgi:hypothetical protein
LPWAKRLSLDEFHHHPHYSFLITKTLRRIVYYWTGYWSFSAEELRAQPFAPENCFYVSCITLLMLRGLRRFWLQNRAALWPYLVLIGIFPITYYLTKPIMDYRQAIEPAVIVLVVSGMLPWKRLQPSLLIHWAGAERALEPEFAVIPSAVLASPCSEPADNRQQVSGNAGWL